MANDNFPRGLVPINLKPDGAHYYRVSSSADIWIGELAQISGTGYAVAGSITAIEHKIGVFLGFAGPDRGGTATDDPYLDASDLAPPAAGLETGDRWALIADDPQQLYYIQEDTGGTALALADVFAACDLIYRGSSGTTRDGDTTTGFARLELDGSQVVTTTAAVVQIVGLHETMNSDGTRNAVGDYAKWVVRILHHAYASTAIQTPVI